LLFFYKEKKVDILLGGGYNERKTKNRKINGEIKKKGDKM
jgi:hypothetical protein